MYKDVNFEVVPLECQQFVAEVRNRVGEVLTRGEQLSAVAYIGSNVDGTVTAMPLNTASFATKEQSGEEVRRMARYMEADYVLLAAEAWSLPKSKISQYQAIMEKYGSLSQYPKKLDVVTFTLETRRAAILGQAPILPCPPSKKRRKMGAVEWTAGESSQGLLANFLPKTPV